MIVSSEPSSRSNRFGVMPRMPWFQGIQRKVLGNSSWCTTPGVPHEPCRARRISCSTQSLQSFTLILLLDMPGDVVDLEGIFRSADAHASESVSLLDLEDRADRHEAGRCR